MSYESRELTQKEKTARLNHKAINQTTDPTPCIFHPGNGQICIGNVLIATMRSSCATAQWLRDGELIQDAFNTYHETGLTPRELKEQRDELNRALIVVRKTLEKEVYETGQPGTWATKLDDYLARIYFSIPENKKKMEIE